MKNILSILLVGFLAYGCQFLGPNFSSDDPKPSKAVKVSLYGDLKTDRTDWVYCPTSELSFKGTEQIDSIIFAPNLRSQSDEMYCIAELYNHSEKYTVTGSVVYSRVGYFLHIVRSNDLSNSMPRKDASVGIRFRSSNNGHQVEIGPQSHVTIYYH